MAFLFCEITRIREMTVAQNAGDLLQKHAIVARSCEQLCDLNWSQISQNW